MASTIVTKNSSTASAVPVTGDLTQGELAVNVTDKKLYTKDSGGTVVKLVGGLGNQEANAVAITGGSINGTTVGATTASTGAFTTLSASSTVSGTGFSTYLASPPAIGGTAAAAGSFTTLSASSTTTLSGGTANGVAYLNGSKVVTTGSALTFDGSGNFTSTGAAGAAGGEVDLKLVDSTSGRVITMIRTGATFNYAGIGGAEAALYTASNNLNLVADGGSIKFNVGTLGAASTQMWLTSTGLGIGTSSPAEKLNIGSGGSIRLNRTDNSATGYVNLTYAGAGVGLVFDDRNSEGFSFRFNGSDKLRLDTNGNLGLGVTPSAWGLSGSGYRAVEIGALGNGAFAGPNDVNWSSNAYYSAGWKYGATNYASQYNQTNGKHIWYTAPSGTAGNAITFTQAMTLDASGNLLLGGTSNSFSARFYSLETSATEKNNFALYTTGAHNTTRIALYNDAGSASVQSISGNLSFSAGGVGSSTERARIDSSGNLGVGVTSPAARLDIYSPSTTAATPIAYMGKALNDSTTSNVLVQFLINSGGTGSGQINANGASAAAFGTYSDERLKENIETLDSQLSNVCSLRPVEFDYKDGSGHQIGFIAQEMQNVYPDCIGEDSEGMLTITGWSKTEARLVKALQEMKAIIDEQAARIAALEAK